MHQLDDVQLYDLLEAGRLLFRDPVCLAREARSQKIPSASGPAGLGLPVPWVDAVAGTRPEDPEAARYVWLRRLAPPSPDAHRATRPRHALPIQATIPAASAAERLLTTPAALERMDATGQVPSLRVDGSRHYDPVLIELLAQQAAGEEFDRVALEKRRQESRLLAQFEYRSHPAASRQEAPKSVAPKSTITLTVPPVPGETPADSPEVASEVASETALDEVAPAKPTRLIRAEGFETVDEDD